MIPQKDQNYGSSQKIEKLIYHIVSLIPKGKVMSYSQIAYMLSVNPRLVGKVLHLNPNPLHVPCHRVVFNNGRLSQNFAFGKIAGQAKQLNSDGIEVINYRVNLDNYRWQPSRIFKLYVVLLVRYGFPGPWPWFGNDQAHNQFEISVGSILTQATSWRNASLALNNLKVEGICGLHSILELGRNNFEKLKLLIKPAGFFNRKASCLLSFAEFIIDNFGTLEDFFRLDTNLAREKLLKIRGISYETADSILLYAGGKTIFVVDLYTKRFVKAYKLANYYSYYKLQKLFTTNLPDDLDLFRNYHALIVKWGQDRN